MPGTAVATALPEPATTTQVDGYGVALDGALVAGAEQRLTFSVSRDGEPVTDLEPYLGAYGAPGRAAGGRPRLPPRPPGGRRTGRRCRLRRRRRRSAGDYRLFLDFQHDGVVRTAELTVHVGSEGDGAPATSQVELSIGGMTCASCANRIERKLNKLDGVVATVNYATEKAKVEFHEGVRPPTW